MSNLCKRISRGSKRGERIRKAKLRREAINAVPIPIPIPIARHSIQLGNYEFIIYA